MKGYKLNIADHDFIYSWFSDTRKHIRLELVKKHGLIQLDSELRFTVKNSFERDYEDMRLQILEAVYWRDGENCAYCNRDIALGNGQIDHWIPRSAWPKEWLWLADDSSNLVAACKSCNQTKSNYWMEFWGENRLNHISFDCKSPKRSLYECCISRAQASNKTLCQTCDYDIQVVCRVHEECNLPACEITVLKRWFGHE
jgi:hypothetical protein